MINAGGAVGQAIFIRTNSLDYAETIVPFHSLEEMAALCLSPKPNLTLEKLVIFHSQDSLTSSVTLDFISASRSLSKGVCDAPH
jgi:hypothetical protein